MATMADRVMAAAKLKNMKTMAEVERYCDIPARTLTNMANDHKPREETLRKICESLDITEDYVLRGIGEPKGVAEQQSLLDKPKAEIGETKPNELRQFVNLLASLDDNDFDTVIEYMTFLKSRKG